jgi:tetratricopeptide (TPR) repeat protein
MAASTAMIEGVRPALEERPVLEGLNAHDENAAASLLGEFRTSFANWLWVRTDLYLHNGVQMRRLTDREISRGKAGSHSSDNHDHELHDDSVLTTVIPAKEEDFRGIFGDIERATSTYKCMKGHNHNEPDDTLPLFRLMTWSDPQFIPGWTTAAAILARNKANKGPERAVALLDEALESNPHSVAILAEKGRIQANKQGRFENAIRTFEKARAFGKFARDEDDLEGLRMTYRWLALLYRDFRSEASARAVANEGLRIFTDDSVLIRMSR